MKVSFLVTPQTLMAILNETTGCVEVTCDLTFDESNGSQVDQVNELC
jgi:hypothetical protein